MGAANKPASVRPPARKPPRAQWAKAVISLSRIRDHPVWFWINHFVITLHRGECTAVAGACVEEAIHAHVAGRSSDRLLAVMGHPAMLR